MKHLMTAVMLLFASLAVAQTAPTEKKAGRTAESVSYFLPKTALRLNFLIEKKVFTPGEFCKYAEKYLRLTGIPQEEEVTHSIVRFGWTTIGLRDTSKFYTVHLAGKTLNADIRLSDDGVLQAINAEPSVVKLPEPFKPAPQPTPINPRHYLSAEVLAAGSLAKMAELTVMQIIGLQEHRQQLITGEAEDTPTDKEELQLMLDQIDKEREILMSMFLGTTTRDTTEQVMIVCPEKEVQKEVLFRLNKKTGIVDKDDLSGIPYYMTVEDLHRATNQPYDVAEAKKDGGFWVNEPGKIKFTLYREDHLLGGTELYAPQFGYVQLRSGSLFKRYTTHMVLSPIFGNVERIQADMGGK